MYSNRHNRNLNQRHIFLSNTLRFSSYDTILPIFKLTRNKHDNNSNHNHFIRARTGQQCRKDGQLELLKYIWLRYSIQQSVLYHSIYPVAKMGPDSLRKQRNGSQITLGNYFQATPKFGAMKVKNLHLRKGARFQPPISFPIVVHG